MGADADELAQIYNGTFAVARGSTKERYELADGRGFDIRAAGPRPPSRRTGSWNVLAIHTGTNFLDNPVINAIERNTLYFAIGGAGDWRNCRNFVRVFHGASARKADGYRGRALRMKR